MNKKELENELYENCSVEIDLSLYESWEDLEESLTTQNMFDEDVIYYSTAMDYLRNEDASLQESMELANCMGYELSAITSELLATLLKSQTNRDNFYLLEADIEEYYESLED